MRLPRRAMVLVAIAVVLFGGCDDGDGGDDGEAGSATTSTTARSTTSSTASKEPPFLTLGAVPEGTYRAQVGKREATVTLSTGWVSAARPDSFELFRGVRGTATEQLAFQFLPATTAEAVLTKIQADGSAEVENETAVELGGLAAKRYDLRIKPDRQRVELFAVPDGYYELTTGHQATMWIADDGGDVLLAIAEGKDDTIERFRPLATSVVESFAIS